MYSNFAGSPIVGCKRPDFSTINEGDILIKATEEMLYNEHYMLFIYSPFCGTCQLARTMLDKIESVHHRDIFLEMNASLHPDFMQDHKIESVPCLLVKDEGQVKEKIYVFHSIANIYHFLLQYERELFAGSHAK